MKLFRTPSSLLFLLFFLFISMAAQATPGAIKGKVLSKDGQPVPNVNVFIKELKTGITTQPDGTFVLPALPNGQYTLVVSHAGLQTQQKTVEATENTAVVVEFVLAETNSELQEVVFTHHRSLNEKVATIGKGNIKPMDMPQASVSIGREVLERQQVLRLSDAIMNASGIYVMSSTGGTQEEIAGRGYAYGSSNTFKNGARYNNGAMPEMSALEKVEILKGSAAILYGNVAAGGVLNLVTKKPQFEKGGEIGFRAGSYAFYKPSLELYGAINNSQSVAFRINTTYEKGNSFRDEVSSERFYINPSLLIKAGNKTSVLIEGDYLTDKRTLDYGTGAINYSIANIPRNRFLGASWSNSNIQQQTLTVTTRHDLGKGWELRNISSYQGYHNQVFGTTRPNAGNFVQTNGNWVRGLVRTQNEEDYYLTQFDITGKLNTGKIEHQLLFGADADKYEVDATAFTYANPALQNRNIYDTINIFDLSKYRQRSDIPLTTATTLTHTPTQRIGVYAQDLISLSKHFKLLAGIRYSYMETGGGYIDSLTKNKRTITALSSNFAFSPRAGLVYQPSKQVSVFASYSNSFTLNTGTDIYLKALDPSYINQYEAGVKTELFQKLLAANLTVYLIQNSNLAQTALTDANGNANNNSNIKELAGEVISKGVELDVASKPVKGFTITAAYSFNDTRYGNSNTYVKGSKLRYSPQHTANMGIYYAVSNGKLRGLNAGVVMYYVGERVAGRSTRTNVANDAFKLMPVDPYAQIDINAGYTWQKLSLRAKLSNLTNVLSYNVHDDNSVNPIAPRMFSIGMQYRL
ncbi:TonB-dependent siderophore receptor [Phnomibacter sp. MR]|uniref:TonB-dependent siderophore receptor n=1 Tax=Phnomibacter sp. MR TaxID=3042318 RepID=UPI003A7FC8E1